MKKTKATGKKPTPTTYAEVAGEEWIGRSLALRMLVGEKTQWKGGDLDKLRKATDAAIEKGEIEKFTKPGAGHYKPRVFVKTAQFFQWAWGKRPDECARLGVPIQANIAFGLCGISADLEAVNHGLDDIDGLRRLYIEAQCQIHRLVRENGRLMLEITALMPDAEKYRAQSKRGKGTGGIRDPDE